MFKKGDIVRASHFVTPSITWKPGEMWEDRQVLHQPQGDALGWFSTYTARALYRVPLTKPVEGLMMGYSTRQTGWTVATGHDSGLSFQPAKSYRVALIQPLNTSRYVEPWACLVEDVELVRAYQGGGGDASD